MVQVVEFLQNLKFFARYKTDGVGQDFVPNILTTIVYNTKETDTHDAMNATTGVYTFPEDGIYTISTHVFLYGRDDTAINGRAFANFTFTGTYDGEALTVETVPGGGAGTYPLFDIEGTCTREMKKGDTVKVEINHSAASTQNMTTVEVTNYLQIVKVGASEISNNQSGRDVITKASISTVTNVVAETSAIKVLLSYASIDTTASFNAGSNRIDILESGHYDFDAQAVLSGVTSGNEVILNIYNNGTFIDSSTTTRTRASGGSVIYSKLSGIIKLEKGDYIEMFVTSAQDGTYDILQNVTWISLAKRASAQIITGVPNKASVVNKTASASLAIAGEEIITTDSSAGDMTLTLPPVAGNSGLTYSVSFKSGANRVTVDGNGANIGGDSTVVLASTGDCIRIACDGFNWYYLSRDITYSAVYNVSVSENFDSAVSQTINFNNKDIDTHNAVTVGNNNAWEFTAPVSGLYNVAAMYLIDDSAGSWSGGENCVISIKVNGIIKINKHRRPANPNRYLSMDISGIVRVNKGETITIIAEQASGVNLAFSLGAYTQVMIHKI